MGMAPDDAADLLRTLGDPTRLQILALLRRRELCVCEVVALFPISQPAISGHLRRLRDAGLVRDERRGMWVHYRSAEGLPALVEAVLAEVVLPAELQAAAEAPLTAARCGIEEAGAVRAGPLAPAPELLPARTVPGPLDA